MNPIAAKVFDGSLIFFVFLRVLRGELLFLGSALPEIRGTRNRPYLIVVNQGTSPVSPRPVACDRTPGPITVSGGVPCGGDHADGTPLSAKGLRGCGHSARIVCDSACLSSGKSLKFALSRPFRDPWRANQMPGLRLIDHGPFPHSPPGGPDADPALGYNSLSISTLLP